VLKLHDTATQQVRPFEQRDPGSVSMYVCGPTVYDLPHIGHGRFNLVFDVLRRFFLFQGLDVRYVSNVTDIDDNIIKRAAQENRGEAEVVDQYEKEWFRAMDALGVLRPTATPHATEYVDAMVEMVGRLAALDVAYETSDGVYLSVEKIDGYGLLNHQPLESLRAGARVESNEEKRSPLDFVLWKKAKPGEPTWPSPWGPGRPGWHTECVVMSLDLLGPNFDLHGGGLDLIFPHHENERAQAVALGTPFAHHWMHNGWVMVGGQKMSKSLGNFTTLTELLAEHDPRAYRLLVLRSHYRSQIEVSPETVADAEKGLERLDALARRFELPDLLASGPGYVVGEAEDNRERFGPFVSSMENDLDTPGALAHLFDLVSRANTLGDDGDDVGARELAQTVALLCAALGLSVHGEVSGVDDETRGLVDERDRARAERNWARADELRDELVTLGWIVEDGPTGTVVRR
jgi:cysteinyl-tRNA synthetase